MPEQENLSKYKVQLNKLSRNFLDKIDDYTYDKLISKIFSLELIQRPFGCTKLSVIDGYRIRWGNYRILYTIDDSSKTVSIFSIDNRKDAYRKK
jgi:mRNA interferase RelE/StbE